MSEEIQDLIDGYFDESLSQQQFQQLNQWIKADPVHAQQFASQSMLHDRLHNEFAAKQLMAKDPVLSHKDDQPGVVSPASRSSDLSNKWIRSMTALATTACLVAISTVLFWNGLGTSSASAAMTELNRIITVNRLALDRTFLISVEDTVSDQNQRRSHSPENQRPPKPSLDNAVLDVRGSNQFVLRRKVAPGVFFVTGSNGTTSWAVRPDGPVRISNDLTRFNRDLPGHERSLPINNIEDGLAALHTAYELNLRPLEGLDKAQFKETAEGEVNRQMVAIKKAGFPGPPLIEINYDASSGQIQQMRFVEMPYGRNMVTLKMTLADEQMLASDYFDHQSHHDSKRIVEFE